MHQHTPVRIVIARLVRSHTAHGSSAAQCHALHFVVFRSHSKPRDQTTVTIKKSSCELTIYRKEIKLPHIEIRKKELLLTPDPSTTTGITKHSKKYYKVTKKSPLGLGRIRTKGEREKESEKRKHTIQKMLTVEREERTKVSHNFFYSVPNTGFHSWNQPEKVFHLYSEC